MVRLWKRHHLLALFKLSKLATDCSSTFTNYIINSEENIFRLLYAVLCAKQHNFKKANRWEYQLQSIKRSLDFLFGRETWTYNHDGFCIACVTEIKEGAIDNSKHICTLLTDKVVHGVYYDTQVPGRNGQRFKQTIMIDQKKNWKLNFTCGAKLTAMVSMDLVEYVPLGCKSGWRV